MVRGSVVVTLRVHRRPPRLHFRGGGKDPPHILIGSVIWPARDWEDRPREVGDEVPVVAWHPQPAVPETSIRRLS